VDKANQGGAVPKQRRTDDVVSAPVPPKVFTCPYPGCPFQKADYHQVQIHGRVDHKMEFSPCAPCDGKLFLDECKLREHFRKAHNSNGQCPLCSKNLQDANTVGKHVNNHHRLQTGCVEPDQALRELPDSNLDDVFDEVSPANKRAELLIKKPFYRVAYSKTMRGPEYVVAAMTQKNLKNVVGDRPQTPFKQSDLLDCHQMSAAAFHALGMDVGHLPPAASFRFSQKAYEDTFFMPACAPVYRNVNTGTVLAEEKHSRNLLHYFEEIIEISGVAYDDM